MKFFNFLSLVFDSIFLSVTVSVIPFPFPDSGFHVLVLPVKMAPRETENNAYAKFWGDNQRALWYVTVFSGGRH